MHVLLLGDRSAERIRAMRQLEEAGMRVDVCQDGDTICSAMKGGCPIDAEAVDVAVAVAPRGQRLDAQGVACVHRARLPVVTVGATASDPVLPFATRSVARVDGRLVDEVLGAATDATAHERVLEEAFANKLQIGETVTVRADRHAGSIRIVLHGDVAPDRIGAVVEIARDAARRYDPHVKVIDVSYSGPPAETPDRHGS